MPDIFIANTKNSPHVEESTEIMSEDKKTKKVFDKVLKSEEKKDPEIKKIAEEKISFFSTFYVEPTGITFADQEKDEKILLFLRRHMVTNLNWIIAAAFLIIIPPFTGIFLIITGINLFDILSLPLRFTIIFIIFYYSAIFTYILVNLVSWFYNSGLITTRRIMDIDLHDLVFKNIAITRLDTVQDVTYIQHGFLRSVFHFGNVVIQTSARNVNFEIESVPYPDKVAHLIEDFMGNNNES